MTQAADAASSRHAKAGGMLQHPRHAACQEQPPPPPPRTCNDRHAADHARQLHQLPRLERGARLQRAAARRRQVHDGRRRQAVHAAQLRQRLHLGRGVEQACGLRAVSDRQAASTQHPAPGVPHALTTSARWASGSPLAVAPAAPWFRRSRHSVTRLPKSRGEGGCERAAASSASKLASACGGKGWQGALVMR